MKVKGKKLPKNKSKYNGKKYQDNYYSDFDRLIMENPKKTQKERDLQNRKLAKLLDVKPRAKIGPSKKSYIVQGKKKVCAILGCVESQTWPETEFYAFPEDEKYRKLWSELTGRVNWLPDANSVVCGSHFSMDSHVWEETGGVRVAVRLAHDAVPSFNLPPQVMEVSKYVRKTDRGKWSQEQLSQALKAIRNDNMAIRRASMTFNIPRKTLERYYKQNKEYKGTLGPGSTFGYNNERKLAEHIIRMQNMGFHLTRSDLRSISFKFAQQLGIKNKFNAEKQKTGYDFVNGFLTRNNNIKICKHESISLTRIQGMNRDEIEKYFKLLDTSLKENGLYNKPSNIFYMDDTRLQLNTRPSNVSGKKRSKLVSSATLTEKGETITVIACCNAEGTFLPPACIMKGKNKKLEYENCMPSGAVLYMSPKSAYINVDIFYTWLQHHFIPQKTTGKVMLIVNGHASHCSVAVLQLADENDITFLCLPSHTKPFLQPLDRAVFKSLKSCFYEQCHHWVNNHPGRKITRAQFSTLLAESWKKSATQKNATAGFSSTGIFPFNPSVIPDHAFISDHLQIKKETEDFSKAWEVSSFKPPLKITQAVASTSGSNKCSQNKTPEKNTSSKYSTRTSLVPDQRSIVKKRPKQATTVLPSPNYNNVEKEKRGINLKRKRVIEPQKFEMEVQFVEDIDFESVPTESFSTKDADIDYIPSVVPRKKDTTKKIKEPKKKIEGVDKVRLFQAVQRYQNKLIEQYKNLRELNKSIKSQSKQIELLNRQLKEKKEEREEKKARFDKMQKEWDSETNTVKNDNELILMMPSRYSDDMKNLALSIHNYSPEAYIYLRNTLRTILPGTDLLRKWTDSGFRPKTKITSSDAIKLVTENSESEFTCKITIQ